MIKGQGPSVTQRISSKNVASQEFNIAENYPRAERSMSHIFKPQGQ